VLIPSEKFDFLHKKNHKIDIFCVRIRQKAPGKGERPPQHGFGELMEAGVVLDVFDSCG
jgi:hypothetical protein